MGQSIKIFKITSRTPKRQNRELLFWISMFWIIVALLEVGQDSLSAMLNDLSFRISESLSYKLFWLLFIPLTGLITIALDKAGSAKSAWKLLLAAGCILTASLFHLLLFAAVLFGISNIIHQDVWSLSSLIIEKFSTRLYITLAAYLITVVVYLRLNAFRNLSKEPEQQTLSVKSAGRISLVEVTSINWIQADGPYISIHTDGKKFLMNDTLKRIIKKLPENFKRIHRSTIVNTEKIQELRSRRNGDYDVILRDGHQLRLSRNYAQPIKSEFLD